MRFAVETSRAQRELRLNLLAADTIGAAVHYGTAIISHRAAINGETA